VVACLVLAALAWGVSLEHQDLADVIAEQLEARP
tara:strand:+ start:240 stop:341 length:102 start_codon:yes stop_codon:yes gene_type:complete